MFKNFKNYLLVQYPLAWNLRFPTFLFISIILNLLYLIVGYSHNNEFYDFYEKGFDEDILLYFFNFILILIILIIWFIYYFRNNAFKSFYKIEKWHLTKEFFMVLTITTLLFFTTISFKIGENLKFKKLSQNIDYNKGFQTIEQAKCFLVFNQENFEIYNCLDSIKYRDSIYQIQNSKTEIDSCNKPQILNYSIVDEIESVEETLEESETPVPVFERKKEYSHLFYCGENPSLFDDNENTYRKAWKWIKENQKDSIRISIINYLKLLESIGGKYRINLNQILNIINSDRHSNLLKIDTRFYFNEIERKFLKNGLTSESNSIENDFLENTLYKIKNFSLIPNFLFLSLLISFCLTILICLFRFSRLKPFLISILSAGILTIIVGFFTTIFRIEYFAYIVLISIVVFSLIYSMLNINANKNKALSIILIHFFCFGFMLVIPITVEIIKDNTHEIIECINHINVIVRPEHPIREWLYTHSLLIFNLNLMTCLLIFIFIILPLLKKWQANSSE